MPIKGVLDLQRRSMQIGEIRIGTSKEVPGKSYRQPVRLDSFRFTTASEQAANAVAEKYGGQVAPWSQRKGRWEVVTSRTAIDVWVPPRGEAVDANMEIWDGPKRLRVCDGLMTSFPSRKPCVCPQPGNPDDPDSVEQARNERIRLSGLKPPQGCKPITRINVTIPDLPGLLGVWRLNTGSVNAAVETADSGEAMEIAREGGVYLPAVLRLEWRTRSADGKPYPVPVLQIGLSMREIAAGALPAGPSGLLAQLQGAAPGERKAIESASAQPPARPVAVPGARDADSAEASPQEIAEDERRYQRAQGIADECAGDVMSARFTERWAEARQDGLEEEFVYTTDDHVSGPCLPLGERLTDLWAEKARGTA